MDVNSTGKDLGFQALFRNDAQRGSQPRLTAAVMYRNAYMIWHNAHVEQDGPTNICTPADIAGAIFVGASAVYIVPNSLIAQVLSAEEWARASPLQAQSDAAHTNASGTWCGNNRSRTCKFEQSVRMQT